MAITYPQVARAAETILTRGENPTIEKVRVEVGGTGSNSTLSKHLQAWRADRLVSGHQTLPPAYIPPDPVNEAVSRVWQQMSQEMAQEVEKIKATFEEDKAQLQTQYQAQLQVADQLKTENELLHQKCDDYQYEALKAKVYQQKLEQDLAVLLSKDQQNENFIQTLTLQTEQHLSHITTRYEQEIKTLTRECEVWQQQYQQAIDFAKELQEKQRHQYILEIDVLKVANDKLVVKTQQSEQENRVLAEELRHAQTELEAQQQKHQELLSLTQQLASLKQWLQSTLASQANQQDSNHDTLLDSLQIQIIGQEAIHEKVALLITLCEAKELL